MGMIRLSWVVWWWNRVEISLRWGIVRALRLDQRRDLCWAEVAMWAMFPRSYPFGNLMGIMRTYPTRCEAEIEPLGGCFCGMFSRTARSPSWKPPSAAGGEHD